MYQRFQLAGGDSPKKKEEGTAEVVPVDLYARPASDKSEKDKATLAPEETFFEGPPSWTEVLLPAVSVLTVIGIVPFAASLTRQAWVKYKITSRRISVTSGFNGQVAWLLRLLLSHLAHVFITNISRFNAEDPL